jgi:putative colanic acid biosynthesis acetyltransferase WcaF
MTNQSAPLLRPFHESNYINRFSRAHKTKRAAWHLVWCTVFRWSPRLGFNWWRRWLLVLFGARIGWPVYIHPTVRVWAPWNLTCDSGVAIGERVDLYTVDAITIGKCVAISQEVFVCTAGHDIRSINMELTHAPITIGDYAWLASRAYLAPGVTAGEGAVVGACAVVVKDVPPWVVVAGNPARNVGSRLISPQ